MEVLEKWTRLLGVKEGVRKTEIFGSHIVEPTWERGNLVITKT